MGLDLLLDLVEEKDFWILWNQLYEYIGPVKFDQLIRAFGSAKDAWEASFAEFEDLGWGPETLEKVKIEKIRVEREIEKILKKVEDSGVSVATLEDPLYPEKLKEIYDPPPVLYIKGKILPQDKLSLAVVGTRKMTSYGKDAAENLVSELASSGLSIISGLALGIDSAAHRAALGAEGRTIAVLAGGVDVIHPPTNTPLAQQIAASGGALVSEFPLSMPHLPHHFPVRNRIIAGLSLGVLVIEGAKDSGSLYTAYAGLEQGKDVFAVPGSIFNPLAEGTHALIKKGAKLVTGVSDILEELEVPRLAGFASGGIELEPIQIESEQEGKILEILKEGERHVDEIIRESGLSSEEILSTLTLLEVKGAIKSLGSGLYRRSRTS